MVSEALKSAAPARAIVIGGSAGSVSVLGEILPGLPADGPPVLVVVHVMPTVPSLLASVFAPRCAARVREAEASLPLERGTITFAPPDYHLLVEPTFRVGLSIEPPVAWSRPSIDVLFESAADAWREGLVGVVLTGASHDGAAGLLAVRRRGGRCMVQDPETAEARVMPLAAIDAVPDARVLAPRALLAALTELVRPS